QASAARGDGHRDLALVVEGDVQHQPDRLNLRNIGKVSRFFFFGHGQVVQLDALLPGQRLENVARGHSAQGIKALFTQAELVSLEDGLPCFPMERHGIGQGAVAIEDQTLNAAHESLREAIFSSRSWVMSGSIMESISPS